MKNWKALKMQMHRLPVYIAVAGTLSACGIASGTFAIPANNSSLGMNPSGSNVISSSGSTTGGTTVTSGTGAAPALSFAQFGITGSGGATPTWSSMNTNGSYISTDNLLKVRVTVTNGGLLQAPSGYSGFSTNYSCASFNVYIYDDTEAIGSATTAMLQVPGETPCVGSTGNAYQDLDFSGSVINPHGGIEVRVSAANYDFYCKLWYQEYQSYGIYSPYYNYYSLWCPSKAVYINHTVNASLQVEVNGTSFQ